MGDRSDQVTHRAHGQPRVGIECHDIAHSRRWGRRAAPRRQDPGRDRAAQEGIQFLELATLPLPAHPAALGRVPASLAVEDEEPGPSAWSLAVTLIEPVYRRHRRREQFVVAGDVLTGGVEPVRQQGESNIAVAVRQIVDLQAANQCLDVGLISQEHWDDDQSSKPRRHAPLQIEPRQYPRAQDVSDFPVDEGNRKIGSGDQRENRYEDGGARCESISRQKQWSGEDQGRGQDERREVATSGRPEIEAPEPVDQRRSYLEDLLELRPTVGDEVVAGVSPSSFRGGSVVVIRRRGSRQSDGLSGDVDFGKARGTRQFLNCVPIAISSRKVHLAERTVFPQYVVNEAHAFDELGPVEPRDKSHARDHVPDGDVHRRLALMLEADYLLGRRPLCLE